MGRNLTLKSIGIFLVFWLIWNFAWIVSFFTLMNNSPEHYFDSIVPALIIWILGAVVGSVLMFIFIKPIEQKFLSLKKLSNIDLLEVSKKSLNIHFIALLIYGIVWLLATIVMFYNLKGNYGNIAAKSIWVGGLAGFLACPMMVFGVIPLLFSNINRSFSEEINTRGLIVRGIYMNIRNKLLLVFGTSIIGLVIWMGGFAYYTGVNQMIEEINKDRIRYHKIIIQTIVTEANQSKSAEDILKQIDKIQLPSNEFLILFDNSGNLLSSVKNSQYQNKQPLNVILGKLISKAKSASVYDNTNENVMVYSPINQDYNLALAINVSKTERMSSFFIWFAVFLLVGVFVAFANSLSLSAWIAKTIKNLVHLFENLANKDFSDNATKDSEDELGNIAHKYNVFIITVRKLIENIQTAAQTLLAASEEIASNNQALTQRTSAQAASVEELSAVLEEMSSIITKNAANSKQTEEIAIESVEGINLSNQSVGETIDAMKNITEKALLIIGIAKNTDILAINAAIEAARAGQLGKGFAVVANEIRALSENTKQASEQIDNLTKSGIELANRSGKLLANTVEQMKKTSDLVKEVTESTVEQNSVIELITSTVDELHNIAQENASTSEETAASSEELTAQANELFDMVSGFKI